MEVATIAVYISCFLMTIFADGLSEAMNSDRELFGLEKLADVIGDQDFSWYELGSHVLDDVSRFSGVFVQSDDRCLVCFGRE